MFIWASDSMIFVHKLDTSIFCLFNQSSTKLLQYYCANEGWLTVPGGENVRDFSVCGWRWTPDRKVDCWLRAKDITFGVEGAIWKSEFITLGGGKLKSIQVVRALSTVSPQIKACYCW